MNYQILNKYTWFRLGGFTYYYAALLPRRGPHIASHSVCLSVRPVRGCTLFTVAPSYERTSKIEKLLFSLMGQRDVCTFRLAQRAAYHTAISAAQTCFSYRHTSLTWCQVTYEWHRRFAYMFCCYPTRRWESPRLLATIIQIHARVTISHFVALGLGVGRRSQDILGMLGPPLEMGMWLTHHKYAAPHLCYLAKFGHSRSNRSSVIVEILQKILTPHAPPFNVTQCRWNRHGSIMTSY